MAHSITLSINDEYYQEFIAGIIRQRPIAQEPVLDADGNPTLDDNDMSVMQDKYTAEVWVKKIALDYLAKQCKKGLLLLAQDSANINDNVINSIVKGNLK